VPLDDRERAASSRIPTGIDGKTSVTFSFSKAANHLTRPSPDGLPFEATYEMNLIVSLFGAGIHSQSDVNLESIGKARGGFLSTWFAKAIKATRARQGYPLSQYQKQSPRPVTWMPTRTGCSRRKVTSNIARSHT